MKMQQIQCGTELICVDYPGIVANVSNMIDTLGGTVTLSEVLCDPSRKLQLKFRPSDRFCKPITGFRKPSNALLMKVKVKKKSKSVVSYEIVGHVREQFTFSSLCDFQYLAMENGVNVYDKVVPTGLNAEWLKGEGPLILTPALFSRTDTLQGYFFSRDKTAAEDVEAPKVIATSRKRRFGFAVFLNFEDKRVPSGPKKSPFGTDVTRKIVSQSEVEALKQLFEERPVISRSAMVAMSGIPEKLLKDLAPYVAYHFHNGPWRAMWVRFGYDPRKDPSARFYQTLDFRLQRGEDENLVETKRGAKVRQPPVVPRTKRTSAPGGGNLGNKHILTPGKLPPSRQFFYQYCDVHLPEVQALLDSVEVRPECHPTDGWLPEGTSFACRRIIKQYVLEAIGQRKGEVPDLSDYSASSDGGDSSDSDDGQLLSPEVKTAS